MSDRREEPKVIIIGGGDNMAGKTIAAIFNHPRAMIINGELHIAAVHPIGSPLMGREAYEIFNSALPDLDFIKTSSKTEYGSFELPSVIPYGRKQGSRKGKGKSK